MSGLASAAEGLLASLQRAQAELEWVSHRLEEEFAASQRKGEVNPLSLLTRINKLRHELPGVQQECHEVLCARQELVDAVKAQLVGNTEELRTLQRRAGIAPEAGGEETFAAFSGAVAEHEARLRVQQAGEGYELNREELNDAYLHSVMAG